MTAKERIAYLDVAKGICILLVIIFHLTESFAVELPMAHIFTVLRLPLFFFLSGCFFRPYNSWLDFLKHKTNQLLIPFIFWFLLISVLIAYIYGQLGIPVFRLEPISIGYSVIQLWNEENYVNIPTWFLLCLFNINIIFYGIHTTALNLSKRHSTLLICAMSLFFGILGLIISYYGIPSHLYMKRTFLCIPFFAFGYICAHHSDILKPHPYDKFIPLYLLGLIALLYFCTPKKFIVHESYSEIQNYLFYHPSGCIGAFFVLLISKYVKNIPVVRWWGRYSIIILILHLFFYKHIMLIGRYTHLLDSSWTSIWIVFFLTMACCSAAIPICKRFFPHVTAQKDLLK